jgi:type IV secretory pathway protease TraF
VCQSVCTGCTPLADLPSPSLSLLSRLNLWQHSLQIAAICRAGIPLLKRVLALAGQTVCRDQLAVTVDKIEMGVAGEYDRSGRPLPSWQGCHVIADGEVFLMNWQSADSFDGRYFGALPTSAIIGTAEPLWAGEEK